MTSAATRLAPLGYVGVQAPVVALTHTAGWSALRMLSRELHRSGQISEADAKPIVAALTKAQMMHRDDVAAGKDPAEFPLPVETQGPVQKVMARLFGLLDANVKGDVETWFYQGANRYLYAALAQEAQKVLGLEKAKWVGWTKAPANYDHSYVRTVEEVDVPAGTMQGRWRKVEVFAATPEDMEWRKHNQMQRYLSGNYAWTAEDPREIQRGFDEKGAKDRVDNEARNTLRDWLNDHAAGHTGAEVRARLSEATRLGLNRDGRSHVDYEDPKTGRKFYSSDEYKTATYTRAEKAAAQVDEAHKQEVERKRKETQAAQVQRLLAGPLRPLFQTDEQIARRVANAVGIIDGLTERDLEGIEGVKVTVKRHTFPGGGFNSPMVEQNVQEWMFRGPMHDNPRWPYWYVTGDRDDNNFFSVPADFEYGTRVDRYRKAEHLYANHNGKWATRWTPPAFELTTTEREEKRRAQLPRPVLEGLAQLYSPRLGVHPAGVREAVDKLPIESVVQHSGVWGIRIPLTTYRKAGEPEWLVVNDDGKRQGVNTKVYQAFVKANQTDDEKAQEAEWDKAEAALNASFAQGATLRLPDGESFRVDYQKGDIQLRGWGTKSYMTVPESNWRKPEKMPDTLRIVGPAASAWTTFTRNGPKSKWERSQGGGRSGLEDARDRAGFAERRNFEPFGYRAWVSEDARWRHARDGAEDRVVEAILRYGDRAAAQPYASWFFKDPWTREPAAWVADNRDKLTAIRAAEDEGARQAVQALRAHPNDFWAADTKIQRDTGRYEAEYTSEHHKAADAASALGKAIVEQAIKAVGWGVSP